MLLEARFHIDGDEDDAQRFLNELSAIDGFVSAKLTNLDTRRSQLQSVYARLMRRCSCDFDCDRQDPTSCVPCENVASPTGAELAWR